MKNVNGALYECTIKPLAKQKRITCKVCGLEFVPMNDEGRYTVQRLDGTFGDAFDCPQCGCQVIVNERYERVESTEKLVAEGVPEKPKYPKYRSYYKASKVYDDYLKRRFPVAKHTFSNVKQFTTVLNQIHELMDEYMYITLSDFKEVIGDSDPVYTDNLIGWDNIINMKIEVDGNGYTIIMPPYNWQSSR